MPFLGSQPAEVALTTGDLGDNIVDGTKTKDALIADYSDVTITASDLIMYGDATDSNNTKRDTVQGILDLASGLTLGTEQATSSGTSITFGSIPAGTKLIFIAFEAVSTNGTDDILVQIGDAGGVETSAYVSSSPEIQSGSTGTMNTSTAGYIVSSEEAAGTLSGTMTLVLKDSSNYTWISSHSVKYSTSRAAAGGGDKSLSAELTQVLIKPTGSNSFDGGSINIMYM